MKRIEIELANFTSSTLPSKKFFQKITDRLIGIEKLRRLKYRVSSQFKVSLVFISSTMSRQLNKAWRKKNKQAGTLTFNFDHLRFKNTSNLKEFYLGEIFIAPSVIKKKAHLGGNDFYQELTRHFTHAMLHLLGYNHERSGQDEITMTKIEAKVLRSLLSNLVFKA